MLFVQRIFLGFMNFEESIKLDLCQLAPIQCGPEFYWGSVKKRVIARTNQFKNDKPKQYLIQGQITKQFGIDYWDELLKNAKTIKLKSESIDMEIPRGTVFDMRESIESKYGSLMTAKYCDTTMSDYLIPMEMLATDDYEQKQEPIKPKKNRCSIHKWLIRIVHSVAYTGLGILIYNELTKPDPEILMMGYTFNGTHVSFRFPREYNGITLVPE